jgi:hypothetical protein
MTRTCSVPLSSRLPVGALPLVLLATGLGGCSDDQLPPALYVPNYTIEAVGDAIQLEATLGGTHHLAEWESLSPQVASVTRAGMAVGMAPGEAAVRARVGSATREAKVTVLPAVNVGITSASRFTEGAQERARVQLKNTGGRGYYRLQLWRDASEPAGLPSVVSNPLNEHAAPVGMDISSTHDLFLPADFAVVYSREPVSLGYVRTACVRFDGGACTLP